MSGTALTAPVFADARRRRRQDDPTETARIDGVARARRTLLDVLERDGSILLAGRCRDLAARILGRADACCESGQGLMPPADLRHHPAGADYRLAPRLGPADLARGVTFLRSATSAVNLCDPMVRCPEIARIAFDDEILDLAGAYLGCPALLGYVKLTRSFVSDFAPFDTEEFHVDGNARRILKAFVHLHDTDVDSGAHIYVRGSQRDPIAGWDVGARATETQIVARYGRERIITQVARAGDVLLEDTSGFHRRGKARLRDRTLLIVNYVAHEEYGGGGARTRLPRKLHAKLSPRGRRASALLELCTAHDVRLDEGIESEGT